MGTCNSGLQAHSVLLGNHGRPWNNYFYGNALNYAGKFEPKTSEAFSNSHFDIDSLSHRGHTETITIADAHLLFAGDFKRSGLDLILSKDGHGLVVPDYF